MVERLGTGQGGSSIQVTTNFFRLLRNPINNVTVYSLSFTPEIESDNRALRTGLLTYGKAQVEEKIGKFIKTGNVLYSKVAKREPFSVNVETHENAQYVMIVTPVGTVTGQNVDSYRMYANSALKKMLSNLELRQITRLPKFFDIRQTQRVDQHQLEVWRGYTATFSHHLQEMLLNLDFSSKIIRDTTALQCLEEIRSNAQGRDLDQIINSEMIGRIVMAKYGNYKCYRIEKVVLSEHPGMTFMTRDGPINYMDYFKKRYNINIRVPRQPLLVTYIERGTKEIRLIPELCVLTGISEEMKRDFRAMNDIAAFTRLEPSVRLRVSTDLALRLTNDSKCRAISDEYSMQIDSTPIQVTGIRFNMEGIQVSKSNSDIIQIDQRGGFNLRSSLFSTTPIEHWVVLTTDRDAQNRDRLIKTLVNKAGQLGLRMGLAIQLDYHPRNIKNIIANLHQPQGGRPVPQIALIVVPPNDKRIYNDIKEACALVSGIPTQCIKANNLNNPKKFDSIMSKLIVQMAVKTGSVAWQVFQTPGLPARTMVVGIDVFHDTVLRAKSVLGFVASIHPAFTNYYNTTRIHENVGQEIGGHVGDCLRESLLAFYEATRKRFLPDLIIVYRDGVADSQIEAAKKFEVEAMKNIIKDFQGYEPKLVYVIVNKKTNAKFFVQGQRGMENPPAGTVVNSLVIPENQSFYLIAHTVTQGMASPTLYRIIHNDGNIDPIILARFAFKLCYMYYNWTGGIKVPAPTMMAHKLAFLVGQSVHATHLEALRTLPWFY